MLAPQFFSDEVGGGRVDPLEVPHQLLAVHLGAQAGNEQFIAAAQPLSLQDSFQNGCLVTCVAHFAFDL